ncbi:BCCT family transporter [Lamprobacter sp.]|uniref:BCCT family transporter n=1 Tax=Lamprobacter sp. TaxID=3100796 RepID=UPI003A4DEDB7
MAFGPYGGVKLGKDDEEPEFSTLSWIAMLFAGGMGAGLIFWGVAEPLYHFRDPPGMPAEAARLAFTLTMGTLQIRAGLGELVGTPLTNPSPAASIMSLLGTAMLIWIAWLLFRPVHRD